jgi:alpha-ketoglutarate-dependent taurine dioxygenase
MVWVNPLTGEKSFQVQSNAARRLFIRNGPDEAPQAIEELSEVREFLLGIQRRILRPEYILIEPEEEGDVLLWDNYGTMHTRIDYPIKYGPKTAHQASVGASRGPMGVSN